MFRHEKRIPFKSILIYLGICLVLFGCQSSNQAALPATGIETYLRALVEKDLNQLVNAACAAWEEDARQ